MCFKWRQFPKFEDQFERWEFSDSKIAEKIERLMHEIIRHPYNGIGKPERLVNSPYWSRRIDGKHRLVYQVVEDIVWFVSCYGHYGDH